MIPRVIPMAIIWLVVSDTGLAQDAGSEFFERYSRLTLAATRLHLSRPPAIGLHFLLNAWSDF